VNQAPRRAHLRRILNLDGIDFTHPLKAEVRSQEPEEKKISRNELQPIILASGS
jgi:hypothetical protein